MAPGSVHGVCLSRDGDTRMAPACVPLRGTYQCVCSQIVRSRERIPVRESGGEAVALVSVDDPITAELAKELCGLPGVRDVVPLSF